MALLFVLWLWISQASFFRTSRNNFNWSYRQTWEFTTIIYLHVYIYIDSYLTIACILRSHIMFVKLEYVMIKSPLSCMTLNLQIFELEPNGEDFLIRGHLPKSDAWTLYGHFSTIVWSFLTFTPFFLASPECRFRDRIEELRGESWCFAQPRWSLYRSMLPCSDRYDLQEGRQWTW